MKRIIEIEEKDYELSCQRYGDARSNGHQPDYENTAIAQSKPYNPSGDCISRSALQKSYHEECIGDCYVCKRYWVIKDSENKGISHCLLIDNAPTVEITEEQAINKLHETGWLIGHDKEMTTRPQGRWIDRMSDKGYVECPFCHKQITGGDLNFCVKCGADMRGGAE